MERTNKIAFLLNLSHTLAQSKKRVIYVAGAVTGLPYDAVVAKFAASKALLEAEGWQVLNPLDLVPKGTEWPEAMRICLPALCMADTIYLQPDWHESTGAHLEWCTATKMGLSVVFE